jgi:hypothetical protein
MWTRQRQRDEQIEETSLGWDTQRQPERERKQEKQGNKTIDEHIKHNKSRSKRTRRDETRRDETWRDVTWRDAVTPWRDSHTIQNNKRKREDIKMRTRQTERRKQDENETRLKRGWNEIATTKEKEKKEMQYEIHGWYIFVVCVFTYCITVHTVVHSPSVRIAAI